jgi:raffinose/stachyose/melibiose transport system substrate-binding protein
MSESSTTQRPTGSTRRAFLGRAALASAGVAGVGLGGATTLLAGCGSSGELGKPRTGGSTETDRLSMIGVAQPNPGRGFTKLLDDYKKREGVETKYQYFPSERFVALFTAAQKAKQPLDVLLLNGQDIRRYATNGTLLPLDLDYTDRFRPLGPKTYTINGKLWGIPTGGQGGFMILYNKKLLDQIGADYPATYDDLRSIGKELSTKGVATFTHPGKNVYLWPVWFFTTYAQTTKNKSEEKTIALLKGDGSFTDPEVVEALDLIFAFHRDGLFSKDVLSIDTDGSMANMQRSKAAFWLGGDYGGISQNHPAAVDPRLQVLPRLVSDASVTSQFPGGPGSPLCLYKGISEESRTAALKLIDYLSSDASASYLVKDNHGAFTTNANAQGSDDPAAKDAAKYIDHMTVYLDWYWPPEITAAFQQGIQAGVAGSKNAEQVAADIQATWQKVQQGGWKFA